MRLAQKPDRLSSGPRIDAGRVRLRSVVAPPRNANAAQIKSTAAHSSSARSQTPDSPPIVVKLLPIPKTNADLAAESKDRKALAEAVDKTERLNTWLAVIASLLAALGAVLGVALVPRGLRPDERDVG